MNKFWEKIIKKVSQFAATSKDNAILSMIKKLKSVD